MRNGQTNDYGWGATPELTTPYLNWNDIGDPLESYQAPIWHHLCGRMYQWVQNTAAKSRPWIVTEYGLFERQLPTQVDHPEFQRRLARSYLHFAAWSAFSAGHAGTPLKWCDGLNYGEMFPRGAGPFSAAKYPDLRDEITPLRSLLLQIDLASLTTRTSCLVTAPGGGASPIRCWGIKSTSKAVLWLFDDDFDKTQGATWGQSTRTYTSAEAASKQDHTVHITGLAGNRTYTIEWYNTWDGGVYRTETAAASAAGNLDLLVHTMSTTTRTPQEAWDGADVLLLIQ